MNNKKELEEKLIDEKKESTPEETNESEKHQQQIVLLNEKNLLLAAQIENERKLRTKEAEQTVKYANRKIITKILPLIENYKRALLLAERSENKEVKNFVIGFEMILNDFKDNLKTEGVEEYHPLIEKEVWNSNFCEVVDEVEDNEHENGTILQVIQSGYFLHERLLSPAKVIVSKKSKNF